MPSIVLLGKPPLEVGHTPKAVPNNQPCGFITTRNLSVSLLTTALIAGITYFIQRYFANNAGLMSYPKLQFEPMCASVTALSIRPVANDEHFNICEKLPLQPQTPVDFAAIAQKVVSYLSPLIAIEKAATLVPCETNLPPTVPLIAHPEKLADKKMTALMVYPSIHFLPACPLWKIIPSYIIENRLASLLETPVTAPENSLNLSTITLLTSPSRIISYADSLTPCETKTRLAANALLSSP